MNSIVLRDSVARLVDSVDARFLKSLSSIPSWAPDMFRSVVEVRLPAIPFRLVLYCYRKAPTVDRIIVGCACVLPNSGGP